MRKGAGATLRRGAASVEDNVAGPDTDSPWDRVVLRRDRLAEELLALGPDVLVESPPELRDDILARLRATVGTDSMRDAFGESRPWPAPRTRWPGC